MKKVMYKITIILLIGIMLISSYFVFRDCKEDKKQEKIFEELIVIANNEGNEKEQIQEVLGDSVTYAIQEEQLGTGHAVIQATKLLEGKNIAVVSDAGTPGICDPGEVIIKKCIEENIKVVQMSIEKFL